MQKKSYNAPETLKKNQTILNIRGLFRFLYKMHMQIETTSGFDFGSFSKLILLCMYMFRKNLCHFLKEVTDVSMYL